MRSGLPLLTPLPLAAAARREVAGGNTPAEFDINPVVALGNLGARNATFERVTVTGPADRPGKRLPG